MFKRLKYFGKDDKGQMLTEMAVAVPVVLFMFFTLLQYLITVNVRLSGHYAAFVAARAYTVHLSADAEDAQTFAKLSAAMAYTPVSGPAPGELFYYAAQSVIDPLQNAQNEINNVLSNAGVSINLVGFFTSLFPGSDSVDSVLGSLPKPLRNFLIAYLRNDFHQSDIEISQPDSRYNLPQFTMRMNYRLPLWVPGFAELYNYIGNEQTADEFDAFVLETPAIIVHSICTMGHEPWSGNVNDRSDNRNTAENSEEGAAESFEDLIGDAQEQQQAIRDQGDRVEAARNNLAAARQQLSQLQSQCNGGLQSACDAIPNAESNVDFWEAELARRQAELERLADELESNTTGEGL
jgi:hypothetical protein